MSCKNKDGFFGNCEAQAECLEREKFGRDKCLGRVTAFEMDTCLIRYKPRLLYVDPCLKKYSENSFPTLDEALRHVKKNSGGYVIKLSRGTHRLGVNVEQTIDDLTIIGDISPVKGVPFINEQRFTRSLIDVVPRYDYRIGKGPFRLTVTGRKIKVSGECDPDFSSICEGDEVGFLYSDKALASGEILRYRVKCAKGNTLTLDGDFGLGRSLYPGEGFFIYPNTTIETGCSRKIFVTGRLEFAGLNFLTAPTFAIGAGIYTSMRNCVVEGFIFLRAAMNSSIPNVITGTFLWSDTAIGLMAYCGVLGTRAVMAFNGNPGASVSGSVFSLCRIAMAVLNGGKAHADSCDFFLNETAVRATSGAVVHIPGSYFVENVVAVNAFYNSSVSSEAGEIVGLSGIIGDQPHFINNKLTIGAEWASIVNVSNLILQKKQGDPFIRLDGRIRESPEDNPDDALGNAGSFVADSPNQYAGID